jgi:dienelactone hydrolase
MVEIAAPRSESARGPGRAWPVGAGMGRAAPVSWRVLMVAAALLCGCVPNQPYRTIAGECTTPGCQTGSIERHTVGDSGPEYLLGIVEFDDQGEQQVGAQMDTLFDRLRAESASQDLCIVIFVHGWEHNASWDDPNVEEFRTLLARLALTEDQHAPGMLGKPRKAVGIYAGWRGRSLEGNYLATLTFWNRKDAAGRVAQGSVRELLGRARALHDTLNRTTWSGKLLLAGAEAPKGDPLRSTRMLTIGHSFGGLIVWTALAQYYTDRAAVASMAGKLGGSDQDKAIPAYGDLVVIVNPAVEAASWEPVRKIVQDMRGRDFAPWQEPVLVEVTSTADEATGIAFPLGRSLDTVTDNFVDQAERERARAAFGHYEPFVTHDVANAPQSASAQPAALSQASGPAAQAEAASLVQAECEAKAQFDAAWRRDGYLLPGWTRQFLGGARLSNRKGTGFDPNDPFWIVQTDASMIAGHSDIAEPPFVSFVTELYDGLLRGSAGCATGAKTLGMGAPG